MKKNMKKQDENAKIMMIKRNDDNKKNNKTLVINIFMMVLSRKSRNFLEILVTKVMLFLYISKSL